MLATSNQVLLKRMSSTGSMPLTKIITLLWIVLNYNATLIIAASSNLWEPNGFVLEVYASRKSKPFWLSIGRVHILDGVLQVGDQAGQTTLHWYDQPYYVSPAPRSTQSGIARGSNSLLTIGEGAEIKWMVSDARFGPGSKSVIVQPAVGTVYGCDPTGTAKGGTKFIYQPDPSLAAPPCNTLIFFKVVTL